ncbi:M48 family metallopeptidase [Hydrogenimonas sp.]
MGASKRRRELSAEALFDHRCSDGTLLPCRHLRRHGVKNLTLRIRDDGSIQITTPWHCSAKEAERFVSAKEGWIRKRLNHRDRYARPLPDRYEPGCRIWYLVEAYEIGYRHAVRSRVDFSEGRFLFYGPDTETLSVALERFYRRQAWKILPQRAALWSQRMGVSAKEVRLRRYKSRWGSCRSDGVITFNTALVRYEMRLVDYVVIHELAHLRHRDHQKAFWAFVERFEPDYRTIRKMLV